MALYRNRLEAGHDKTLFLAAWGGGTIVLLALKLFEAPDLAVVGWTALVLLAYAAAISRSPRFRAREDRSGDSCYYLGFLLTLSSLAYALWEFGRNGNDTGAVIENFAIALTGTILGLVLRVLFQQFRDEPMEIEKEVRAELSEVAARLRAEIIQVIEDFGSLRQVVTQEMQNEFTKAVRGIAAASTDAVVTATSSNQKAVSAALANITVAAESMKTQVATVQSASKRTADAFDNIAQKLETTKLPTTHLEQSLTGLTEMIAATVEEHTAQLRVQGKDLEEASKIGAGTAEAMRKVFERAQGMNQVLQALSAGITTITRSFEDWNAHLDNGVANWKSATEAEREAIETQREFLEQSRSAVMQLQAALRSALSDSQGAVVETHRSLASLADTITDKAL